MPAIEEDAIASGRARLDIVLPCLDEVGALRWVLARIPADARAIVVDNGSRDGSPELAAELGATVIRCARRGYGAACHAGLEAATAELVGFCDCDASLDPGILGQMADLVSAGSADMIVGRRRPVGRGAWPVHARVANIVLAQRIRRSTGARLHDLGPVRLARRESLLGLGITDRRSGYPLETVVKAARAGWLIREQDVAYLPRAGKSKVTGTWRGTWHAVRDMNAVFAQ